MASARDSQDVVRHDEHKLRRFLAARRSGDEATARRWWDELVCDNFDRVRAMVRLRSRGHLSPDEQDEALQRALIKLSNNMMLTFRGASMGEWVESTRTLVYGVCIDTQRRATVISRRERALSQTDDQGQDTERLDAAVYAAIERERRDQDGADQDAEDLERGRGFLDWAVPRLSPKRRAVIELDRKNVPVDEIQARLGVTRDVVYASRSRALKDLARLRGSYQP